jgi:chromosome segregation ATPase
MDPDAARTDSPMEARIARIESDVAHMRTDVADIKADQRSMRDKIDSLEATLRGEIKALEATLRGEIKRVETSLLQKLERLNDGQGSLKAEIASAKNWGLALSMTLTGVMLTVMARGFGWV